MPATQQFLTDLTEVGLCAIIRCKTSGTALPIARTLMGAGVRMLEVTLTTPDAIEVIAQLAGEAPAGVWVGAGTAISASDVERTMAAGGRFVVTPGLCPAIEAAASIELPCLAGAWTASEVMRASEQGATAVKIFPANTGGPPHLKALRDPLPHIPLVAVGGVGLHDIRPYRLAGAIGFGIGGPLIGDAARGGSLQELALRATDFVRACQP